MGQVVEKTAKTISQALAEALEELGVSEEQVDYEVLEYPSKGLFGVLGAKPARIRVKLRESRYRRHHEPVRKEKEEGAQAEQDVSEQTAPEPREYHLVLNDESLARAKAFLSEIFRVMELEVEISSETTEEGYVIRLEGENLGILIGKRGQTLDALQYLANLAANRGESERIRVILDIENYRDRREETLRNLAKRLADKAVRMHQDVKLEPMNRHERKIIHMALQEYRRVTTTSEGEEPYRCVIIMPNKQRRGGRRKPE